MNWLQDVLLMFGTGGVTSIILKIIDRKSITRQTLAMLTYSTLSAKIERLLDQDYATPEQRREIEQSIGRTTLHTISCISYREDL